MTQPFPPPRQHHTQAGYQPSAQQQTPHPHPRHSPAQYEHQHHTVSHVAAAPAPRNGLGLAALIIAPIGVLFGLIPLTGFVAVIAAVVAIPLALVGVTRVRRGQATNGKTSWAGLILGVLALALGIWGITIVSNTLDELSGPAPVSTSPGGGQTPQGDGASGTSVAGFGQNVTFDDGVVVAVAQPEAFRPSRFAAGHNADRAVRFEVTVTNGSDQPLDAVAIVVNATFEGGQVSRIFDSNNAGTENPVGTVLPGKATTFSVALSLPKQPGELQVEVTPAFIGDPAIFTGQV